MKMLRIAAALVLLYGCVVLTNGLLYLSWSGGTSELIRMLVRVIGTALVAYGLWSSTRWGWWFGMFFSGILALAGIVGLAALFATDALDNRPYPIVDIVVFVVSIFALCGAFVCLLTGSARVEVRKSNYSPTE